ncbi:MAG TPA: LytTR family DNA-binding domain-containing protein [Flavitalea sp.]|nr:LytTR family DNA-binding domain-containing protein [Flavitalea sp.]
MKLNCIIIDDEPLARKGLREYIGDVEFLHLTGEFDNPLRATDALMDGKVDLMFLDIQMPKITGMEFLKSLANPPLVIFTTAYPEYAVDGFELNAADYLLKPFSFDRFWKAVVKARTLHDSGKASSLQSIIVEDDHFFIKTDNKLVKVNYSDILYVEALQNYIAVHTINKKYITYLTFKSVEESLPQHIFLKVHKSYLVSLSKIESIEANEIIIGIHHIPISRAMKEEVMDRILKGKYLRR